MVDFQEQRQYFLPFRRTRNSKAIVLVHGFSEDVRTWVPFARLLLADKELRDWDIYSLGFKSRKYSFLSRADQSLEFASYLLSGNLTVPPIANYPNLAVVAHSTGGLLVQKCLAESSELTKRVTHCFLFGTPSGGSIAAERWRYLGPQLRDQSRKSKFLEEVRAAWIKRFQDPYPFDFYAIAADRDKRVKPESVWHPDFPPSARRAISGTHDDMIQPRSPNAMAFQIVKHGLLKMPPRPETPTAKAETALPNSLVMGARAFISYSHQDADWLVSLEAILTPVLGPDVIRQVWDDKRIAPGVGWAEEIQRALGTSRLGILLVTPAFLDSEYIATHELPVLLDKWRQGELELRWILVQPVKPKHARSKLLYKKLLEIQAVNDKPLSKVSAARLAVEVRRIADQIKVDLSRLERV